MAAIPFIYDLIVCSLGYIVIYQFLRSFFESKKINQYIRLPCFISASFVLAFVNQLHNYFLNFFVYFILTCVLCFFLLFPFSIKSIGLSFFAVALAASIELIMLPVVSTLLKEKLSIVSGNSEFQFAYSVFNQIILFVIFQIIIRLFSTPKYSNSKSVVLLILPSASIITGFVLVYLDGQQQTQSILSNLLIALSCVGLLLTNILIFYVYDKSLERYRWEAQYNLLENSNKAQLEYYRRLDGHWQDMKVERHDFKSNLQIMLEMLDTNPEKVADYIKTVYNRVSSSRSLIEVNVNNPALSAILQEKYDACKKCGIDFNYIFEYNDLSFLDISDTCAIFENALNNAFEACNNITDTAINKYIKLRIIRHNNMLIINIKNSRTNELKKSDSGYVTSKPNPEQHGLGIISIQMTANRYGGEVTFSTDSNSFTVVIRLNIPPQFINTM